MNKSAVLSPDGRYRYALHRVWDETKPPVLFIGLNPSTADAERDDPTIRRCVRFARDWGYGGLAMGNLFAWRATNPADLPADGTAVGPDNDAWLARLHQDAGLVVAAWGAHPLATARAGAVISAIPTLYALGVTASGAPRHPLRLRADTPYARWPI